MSRFSVTAYTAGGNSNDPSVILVGFPRKKYLPKVLLFNKILYDFIDKNR